VDGGGSLISVFGGRLRFLAGETSDIDLSRKVYLLFFLSMAGIFTLIPLGLLSIYQAKKVLGGFDLALALILTLNLVHARIWRKFEWNIAVGIAFTAVLYIFAFVTGGKNQSAFVWYYTFPLIASFLLGTRRGLVLNLAMLLPVLLLFLAPEGGPGLAMYGFDFKARFIPSYLIVVFFAYVAEHAREQSRNALQNIREKLEERVVERTAELREANTDLEREISEKEKAEIGLSERVKLLALTADIGKSLTSHDRLGEVLHRCTEGIVKHLDAAFARLWVLNEQSGILELQASSGMYTHLDGPHSRIPLGEKKIGSIARDGEAIFTNSVIGDPNVSDQGWALREGMVSFAGHPLHVSGRLIGVMALFAKNPLAESVPKALASIADQIAIGIDRKLTENKLVHSEEYLRSIVNAEPECVKLLDEDGIVLDMNPSGLSMVEATSPEQVVGKCLYDLVHPEHREAVKAFTWKVSRGSGGTMQFRVVGLRGGVRWLETHAVPFADSRTKKTLVLAVTRDITERRDVEKSLRKVKEDLERHNEELKKLDKMKSAFIYAVSHELKTPVSKHSMQLEILKPLLKKYDLSKMERDSIRVMEESIRRQQGVVRNLLDLSRLESGKRPYRLEEVSLDEIFSHVRKEYEYALKSFGVDFEMDVPAIRLWVDGEMLWHVLSNLINNAIKFRQKDVGAHISVHAASENGTVRISIRDNGVGLSAEEEERVFKRFYQASSSIEGTGVGLTICKMIVEGLGGTIRLESDGRDKGTTAILEFSHRAPGGQDPV
jgi:PAS domain S-box-containing protein